MPILSNRMLVVVMAKEAVPGRVKTRFAPEITLEEAAALYQCMIEDRINEMSMLEGIDLAVAYAPADARAAFSAIARRGFALSAQQGNDLGERMQNIFADSFMAGYHAVTIIGSDSPDLPKSAVRESFRLLLAGGADAVFGPSYDGGYYLVGLRRPQPALFENISWSTATVLEATLAKARGIGLKTELLAWWNDLDTWADIIDFYNKYKDKRASKGLRGRKTLSFLATLEKIHRPAGLLSG